MKKYQVWMIAEAEEDLFQIHEYVARHDSPVNADWLLRKLEAACASLNRIPKRGHVPPELETVGVFEYREILFQPYRIIYQIQGDRVYVHCVLDGRTDLQELLQQRLIR